MLHLHILCVSIYYLLYSLLNFGSNFRSLLIFILFIIYRFEEMHLHVGVKKDGQWVNPEEVIATVE